MKLAFREMCGSPGMETGRLQPESRFCYVKLEIMWEELYHCEMFFQMHDLT